VYIYFVVTKKHSLGGQENFLNLHDRHTHVHAWGSVALSMIKRKFLYTCHTAIVPWRRRIGFRGKNKRCLVFRASRHKVDGDRNRKCLGGKRRPGNWTCIRSASTAGAIGSDFRSLFAVRMVVGTWECEGPVSVWTYCCWTILFCKGLYRSQVYIYILIYYYITMSVRRGGDTGWITNHGWLLFNYSFYLINN